MATVTAAVPLVQARLVMVVPVVPAVTATRRLQGPVEAARLAVTVVSAALAELDCKVQSRALQFSMLAEAVALELVDIADNAAVEDNDPNAVVNGRQQRDSDYYHAVDSGAAVRIF